MVEKIKPSVMKKLVSRHYNAKVPLFIYGGFGVGKSTIVKAEAKAIADAKKKEFVVWNSVDKEKKDLIIKNPSKYFVLIDERLSQYEPSDLKGLPKFNDDSNHIEWKIPLWLLFLTDKEADGILFFDEMNLAVPSVLASCYQLFHDREINEQKLSDNILIIGAGNRTTDRANTYDVPLPLKDRKSEFELIVDIDEWFTWALESGLDSDIISFLNFRNDYLLKVENDRESKPITPRGWERTNTLIKSVGKKDLGFLKVVIAGSIGSGVASEFIAFMKLQTKVDLDGLLKNPKQIREITEVDIKYSTLSGLAGRYSKDKKIAEQLLYICKNLEAEFGVLLLKMLKASNPSGFKTSFTKIAEKNKELKSVLVEYAKYL